MTVLEVPGGGGVRDVLETLSKIEHERIGEFIPKVGRGSIEDIGEFLMGSNSGPCATTLTSLGPR